MSLKKIAEELQLSLTTVSRALNGYPEVAERTRQAVLAAAVRHRYQPDSRARGLALGRTYGVGIVFSIKSTEMGGWQFLEVAQAMSERFAQDGLGLFIIAAAAKDNLAAYRRAITGRRVDAFIVPEIRVNDPRLELLHSEQMPFVAYGRSAGFPHPYAWFDFDNEAGARLATERLIGLGHRRIAYLGAPAEYGFATQRFVGFNDALNNAGIAVDPNAIQRGALNQLAGYAAMQNMLSAPQRPTAVLVDNDQAGAGAVHAVLNAGLQLGRDLSLIVYDGLSPGSVIRESITSIEQPTPSAAATMVTELVLARLRGEAPETLQRLLPPTLLIGTSDGPPIDA